MDASQRRAAETLPMCWPDVTRWTLGSLLRNTIPFSGNFFIVPPLLLGIQLRAFFFSSCLSGVEMGGGLFQVSSGVVGAEGKTCLLLLPFFRPISQAGVYTAPVCAERWVVSLRNAEARPWVLGRGAPTPMCSVGRGNPHEIAHYVQGSGKASQLPGVAGAGLPDAVQSLAW